MSVFVFAAAGETGCDVHGFDGALGNSAKMMGTVLKELEIERLAAGMHRWS